MGLYNGDGDDDVLKNILFNKKNKYTGYDSNIVLELTIQDDRFDFCSTISTALKQAQSELQSINETIDSLKGLTPECDKLDYILSASSGALCGILDIFLVGKPGESSIGNISDKWFAERTMNFAKCCGWKGEGGEKSAIRFLERKFKIPYDQRGRGDAASFIFDLSPSNHHFKSLAHNPNLCGLFFSIMDQFQNTSHFVSDGQLICLEKADDQFELSGKDIPGKLFCGFANWFGHLISDLSGSSTGKGRGMGLPSPFWVWINDIIAVKNSIGIPVSKLNKEINELALSIYEKGYDVRFQAAQAIPVFINEMVVRTIYAVRRMFRYFSDVEQTEYSFKSIWKTCEPFSNATVKRMLTVAHGTFCLLDMGDAAVRGFVSGSGAFNPAEFLLRLNITGISRFTVSLYGEGMHALNRRQGEEQVLFAEREQVILENYIEELNKLERRYKDQLMMHFVKDLKNSDRYVSAFEKTVKLAELRGVPKQNLLREKKDIDEYFKTGGTYEKEKVET